MCDRELTERVFRCAREAGAALIGVADVTDFALFPRAVSFAVPHSPEVFLPEADMPTDSYHHEYELFNQRLDDITAAVAALLQSEGYRVQSNASTVAELNRETLSASFSHKLAATRAGLGWIGKSALLITPEFGPAQRLGSLLTDAPLDIGSPITESQCGDCTICQDACPGAAISGENWYAGRPRAEFYDAFACARTAHARSQERGIPHTLCGICMTVCPRRLR